MKEMAFNLFCLRMENVRKNGETLPEETLREWFEDIWSVGVLEGETKSLRERISDTYKEKAA